MALHRSSWHPTLHISPFRGSLPSLALLGWDLHLPPASINRPSTQHIVRYTQSCQAGVMNPKLPLSGHPSAGRYGFPRIQTYCFSYEVLSRTAAPLLTRAARPEGRGCPARTPEYRPSVPCER
ncbi:hypothetical protein E2C01_039656 [Portunus trituberculatus]|uniref:Uncharacterized protein n=1 Tax=Portunus trituberculatus TaxID=210409 RepID=A0A5B7FED8_PORTR|nr:hypothetical protein [Portunus trituberculatus]